MHSSLLCLWGISPTFAGLFPTRGQIVHVLLSIPPGVQVPLRLAWLNRTPIAVTFGRINRSYTHILLKFLGLLHWFHHILECRISAPAGVIAIPIDFCSSGRHPSLNNQDSAENCCHRKSGCPVTARPVGLASTQGRVFKLKGYSSSCNLVAQPVQFTMTGRWGVVTFRSVLHLGHWMLTGAAAPGALLEAGGGGCDSSASSCERW